MNDCSKNRYEEIPLSEKVLKDMTLTPGDHVFIKRVFCSQDEYTEELINKKNSELADQLAQALSGHFISLNKTMILISGNIEDIKKEVRIIKDEITVIKKRLKEGDDRMESIERRLLRVEKYASFKNTAVRIALAVSVSVIVFLLLNHYFTWI